MTTINTNKNTKVPNDISSIFKATQKIVKKQNDHLNMLKQKHNLINKLDVMYREIQCTDDQYDILYGVLDCLDLKTLNKVKKEISKIIKSQK